MSAESDLFVTGVDYAICLLDWAGEVALDESSLELEDHRIMVRLAKLHEAFR